MKLVLHQQALRSRPFSHNPYSRDGRNFLSELSEKVKLNSFALFRRSNKLNVSRYLKSLVKELKISRRYNKVRALEMQLDLHEALKLSSAFSRLYKLSTFGRELRKGPNQIWLICNGPVLRKKQRRSAEISHSSRQIQK